MPPLLSYETYNYQISDELSSVSISATMFRFVGILALLISCLRIEYFLFASLLMAAFGLAAILSQTIRASLANPVESLEYEE